MKKSKIIVLRIISIILMSLLLVITLTNQVFADPPASVTGERNPIEHPGDYEPENLTNAQNASKLQSAGNTIVGVIQIIGTILSVAVLGVIGIKYMIGSVEERAEYKRTMMPYIIGAVLVFGITNILEIIVTITGIFNS